MRTVTDLAFDIQNKSGFRHFTMKGMMVLENFLQGSSGLYTVDGIYGNHVAAFLKIALPLLENYAPFPRKYRNSGKQLIFFLIC